MEQNVIYAFGQFRLQTDTHLLWYESSTIRLQRKTYQLLLYFLQSNGRLISKQELFKEVWEGRIVEDSAVRLAVNTLRKALKDETKTPRYISTTCKCGYRFLPYVLIVSDPNNGKAFLNEAESYKAFQSSEDTAFVYDKELKALRKIFTDTLSGKRNLLLLRGASGLGKTSLLERFLADLSSLDYGSLRARCVPLHKTVEPFFPLLEALERKCHLSTSKYYLELLQQIAPTWLQLIPGILSHSIAACTKPDLVHAYTGLMLREGADFFEVIASESPFILVIDNAHWCDDFTLDLVNFLAFRSSPAKLLIILSYRGNESNAATKRIAQIRDELLGRNLCRELTLTSRSTKRFHTESKEINCRAPLDS